MHGYAACGQQGKRGWIVASDRGSGLAGVGSGGGAKHRRRRRGERHGAGYTYWAAPPKTKVSAAATGAIRPTGQGIRRWCAVRFNDQQFAQALNSAASYQTAEGASLVQTATRCTGCDQC